MDDVYCVFRRQVDYLKFMEVLNSLHPNLEFTVEVGTTQLPFLDVEVELLDGQINTWVYRKETNTDVIMNYHDVTPKSWKAGLVFCFLNRAFNVCSSSVLFLNEVKNLKSIFLRNAYTTSFFDHVYEKFMKKKEELSMSKECEDEDCVEEEVKMKLLIKLPYFGRCSTIFAQTVSCLLRDTFDMKVDIVYSSLKLQSMFQLKCPTPFEFSANVVYRFDCVSDPGLFYVGQTAQHLAERAKEHLSCTDKDSAIGQHIKSCQMCKTTQLSVQNFRILKKCRNKFETKIFEALFIQKLHPTLNTQISNDYGFLLKVFK